jgi:hypothetical protein
MMIEAPDGSTASYDFERTVMAYSKIDAVTDCFCAGCRNYRAAWELDYFGPSLLAACAQIGIEPAKALEMSALGFDAGLLNYNGQLPFFGVVTSEEPFMDRFYPWFFVRAAYGSARFADGLACIQFFVEVPWVLSEPNPYAER